MILIGKTALITGASRGIEKVIAETFVKNGARVIINARKNSAREDLRQYQTVDELYNFVMEKISLNWFIKKLAIFSIFLLLFITTHSKFTLGKPIVMTIEDVKKTFIKK